MQNNKNMEIEIYEPQLLIMPGTTEIKTRFKRTINVKEINKSENEYIVSIDDSEKAKLIDFIESKRGAGVSEFTLHFKSIDQWITSRMIATDKGIMKFSIVRENFKLFGGNCQEG